MRKLSCGSIQLGGFDDERRHPWLAEIGLRHLADKFVDEQIDFDTLALLSFQELRELDVPIGPRRNLLAAIAALGSSVRQPGGDRTPVERRQLTIWLATWSVRPNMPPRRSKE
jgi:hypothetical protein